MEAKLSWCQHMYSELVHQNDVSSIDANAKLT